MFTARSFYSVFLLIALFLFPGIFSTKAFSYFHASRIPEKSKTNRVDYLTITDQMKIHEKYNQNHLARKNEVSVKWISRHPIVLDACFRYTNELSTLPPSRPQVSITGSTVNDHLTPSLSSVKFDKHKHHYYFSARLNLNKNGQIKLSNINTGQWALDSDCSGIHTNDDRRLSSETLVVLSSAAPSEPAQDETKWPAPFPITSADQSQTDDGSYSTGGGYYDDSDNDFKKRPGDGFRSLPFFEYASKLGINLVPVANSHGNTLKLRQQYTLQMNVVLTLFQNGNAREVIISPELWNKIKLFGRYLDPQLVLHLTNNPFDPEQAYQDYLKELSKQSFPYPEGYIHWLLATLPDLIPVKTTILPVNTPTPVSHPGGETEKGNNNEGFTVSGGEGARGGHNIFGQWSSGSSERNNNGGDGGDDGNEKSLICQGCSKPITRLTRGQPLCSECYVKSRQRAASQQKPLPNIKTQKVRSSAEVVVTTTPREVQAYQWLLSLPENEIDRTLLTLNDYRAEKLYQELCYQLRSKPDLLYELAKTMAEVATGSASMKDLLITVGVLAEKNGLDQHKVVSELLLTIIRYSSDLLKSDEAGTVNAARLQRLKGKLLSFSFGNRDFDNAELHPISDDGINTMRTKVYKMFTQLTHSMGAEQIPVTADFLEHLNELFGQLFGRFSFGVPIEGEEGEEGEEEMELWGVFEEHRFMGRPDGPDLSEPRTINLSDLHIYLQDDPLYFRHESILYMAGVVLGYELGMLEIDVLPDNLQTTLLTFLSQAQKYLLGYLDANKDYGENIADNMLSVFGFNIEHFREADIRGRFDLQPIVQQIRTPLTRWSYVEDRDLIHEISNDLSRGNVETLMFLLGYPGRIRDEIENARSPQEKFFRYWLEQNNSTYGMLINILQEIPRRDLVRKITDKYPQMK